MSTSRSKSWTSTRHYGDNPADEELRRGLEDWCVDEPWFATAQEDARFMHCLPVRRGVVVADRVLDGPRSIVIDEAGAEALGAFTGAYMAAETVVLNGHAGNGVRVSGGAVFVLIDLTIDAALPDTQRTVRAEFSSHVSVQGPALNVLFSPERSTSGNMAASTG